MPGLRLYLRGVVDILMRGERVLSGILLRISVGILVSSLVAVAVSLHLSNYYLDEHYRLIVAGDTEGAMETVRTSKRLDPFSPEPLEAEAQLLQQEGNDQEAARVIRDAISRDPASYDLYMNLGILQMNRLNDYDAAVESFRKALERNPNSTLVSTYLAQSLLRQGKLSEAKRVYEDLRKEDQLSYEGFYNLGRIYVRNGEPEKGIRTLERSRRLAKMEMETMESSEGAQREEFVESINLSIADALVVEGQYGEAREIVAESNSDQAAAILELLDSDPELYRESVKNSEIY